MNSNSMPNCHSALFCTSSVTICFHQHCQVCRILLPDQLFPLMPLFACWLHHHCLRGIKIGEFHPHPFIHHDPPVRIRHWRTIFCLFNHCNVEKASILSLNCFHMLCLFRHILLLCRCHHTGLAWFPQASQYLTHQLCCRPSHLFTAMPE